MSKPSEIKERTKQETIESMKALGTYKKEFNQLIDIYAGIMAQYMKALEDFEKSNYSYESETAAGNPKKSNIVAAMESLRKDLLMYSDRLALSPKSLERITVDRGNKSTLATVLSELSDRH